MHLLRFTDLSLRVLMYMTYKHRPVLVTVNEMAERFGWSRHHLVKVVHYLNEKGWILTLRGRGGGLKLAMDPSEYRLGDIIRAIEGDQLMPECEIGDCQFTGTCRIRHYVNEATEAFYESLNKHTLESITSEPSMQTIITRFSEMPQPPRPKPAASAESRAEKRAAKKETARVRPIRRGIMRDRSNSTLPSLSPKAGVKIKRRPKKPA